MNCTNMEKKEVKNRMKKRILIFGYSSLIGGVETFIANLVKYLNKEEFEIDFLVQEEITGINRERIDGYYKNIYVVDNMKKHPIKALKKLKDIYSNNNYDVVHMCLSNASSCLYGLPCKFINKNTKVLIHSHNGGDKNYIQHYFFRNILNKMTDYYLACSELAAIWMFGKKVLKKKKIFIINNAIETEKFLYNTEIRDKKRVELGIKEDEYLIGHVGRFNPQKNHSELIDIFKRVADKDSKIKLLLLGNGKLEEQIKQKVINLKIEDRVIFLGVKENVNECYQAMDLFVLPSIFEGLPIVGIEAQASGLKCIFSDRITTESDITENVKFIELNNIEKWDKQIVYEKNNYDKEKRKDKKIYGDLIKKGYDLRTEVNKIEKIYKGLV